ncbi:transposase, partial [Alteromonas sp. ASW11-130]|uniref:transposase n=1 Tax=Alteromonas sp. ASW11-130 TaxID=3015775 RepID=UPI0022C97C9D|nr:transposase [Alteromonas sp. ASW11-130]
SRCVRRAFLCGKDDNTGKSYEHRRQWVEDRLMFLAEVFCVDVCAYAVMSNHTHVVLRINKSKAASLSVKEVIRRWHKLYKGMLLSQRYVNPAECNAMSEAEVETVKTLAEVYRNRLYDISWFMRLLNEYIARKANKEDGCTGHFWEGRFKSQALMDEAAIAACMAYVDLNPVRACLAK